MVSISLTARPGEKLEIRGVEYVPLLIHRGDIIQSKDMRAVLSTNPTAIASTAVRIWDNNYARENMMKKTRAESLEAMCDLSK